VNSSSILLSGDAAANYTYNTAATTLANITQATLNITANNASKAYNGQTYSGGNGVSYTGFVNGEDSAVLTGTLTYGGTSQRAVTAGNYTITPAGLSADNYTITFINGTLTVTSPTIPPTPTPTPTTPSTPLGSLTSPAYGAAIAYAQRQAQTTGHSSFFGQSAGEAPLTILGTGLNTSGYPALTVLVPDGPGTAEPAKPGVAE